METLKRASLVFATVAAAAMIVLATTLAAPKASAVEEKTSGNESENENEPGVETTVTKSVLSSAQAGAISQSCDTIKQSLRSLQKADSKTRSYLGSSYETFLTDYISPLNLRLVKNNSPSAALTELHSNYIKERQNFTQKFTTYSQDLEALIAMDCQKDPESFYLKLQDTRKSRVSLEQSAEALRMTLTKHQNAVQALKGTL